MDFGRPTDPNDVDWALPPDSALTALNFEAHEPEERPSLYIGSTGWSQKDFVGQVYPPKTKASDFLAAYGKQFNSIELNTTYYRTPDRQQVLKWYAATPDDFRFCPKVNKLISQRNDLALHTSRTLDFAKAVQQFEHKLGPCFIQLPATYTTANFDGLSQWLDSWPPSLRLAVELRHESWYSESRGLDLFAELHARGIGSVITDVGGRRDVTHMHVTAPFTVIRWVGNEHESDDGRLSDWATRLNRWFKSGLAEAYVFTHQPTPVPSAKTAAKLLRFVQEGDQNLQSRAPQIRGGSTPRAQQSELFG